MKKDIPEDIKYFMMLFDGEWQRTIETTDILDNKRWFKGDIIGFVPEDEIQDWKLITA